MKSNNNVETRLLVIMFLLKHKNKKNSLISSSGNVYEITKVKLYYFRILKSIFFNVWPTKESFRELPPCHLHVRAYWCISYASSSLCENKFFLKGKGNIVPVLFLTEHHAMKAYCGNWGIAPRIRSPRL
jgi:hypothetical protein